MKREIRWICKDRDYLFTVFVYHLYCLLAVGTMENKTKKWANYWGKRGGNEMDIHVDQMQDKESED